MKRIKQTKQITTNKYKYKTNIKQNNAINKINKQEITHKIN